MDILTIGKEAVSVGEQAIVAGNVAIEEGFAAVGTEAIQAGEESIVAGAKILENAENLICEGLDLADRMIAMVSDVSEAANSFIQQQLLRGQKLLMEAAKLQDFLMKKAQAAIAKVQAILAELGAEITSLIDSVTASISGAISAELDGLIADWLPEVPDFPNLDLPDLSFLVPDFEFPSFDICE